MRRFLLVLVAMAALLTVLGAHHSTAVRSEPSQTPAVTETYISAEAELSPHITIFMRSDTSGPAGVVELCHRTGSGQGRVIRVSGRAVEAHLSHGDSLTFERTSRNRCRPL
ncbi:MAG TPA: hypothetical protein VLV83_05605 [Acidobacteriota bacterium]|nr:hypothetical protein [Acidobacteriota bacterium]